MDRLCSRRRLFVICSFRAYQAIQTTASNPKVSAAEALRGCFCGNPWCVTGNKVARWLGASLWCRSEITFPDLLRIKNRSTQMAEVCAAGSRLSSISVSVLVSSCSEVFRIREA